MRPSAALALAALCSLAGLQGCMPEGEGRTPDKVCELEVPRICSAAAKRREADDYDPKAGGGKLHYVIKLCMMGSAEKRMKPGSPGWIKAKKLCESADVLQPLVADKHADLPSSAKLSNMIINHIGTMMKEMDKADREAEGILINSDSTEDEFEAEENLDSAGRRIKKDRNTQISQLGAIVETGSKVDGRPFSLVHQAWDMVLQDEEKTRLASVVGPDGQMKPLVASSDADGKTAPRAPEAHPVNLQPLNPEERQPEAAAAGARAEEDSPELGRLRPVAP